MTVSLPTTLFDLINSHLCTEKQIISVLQRLKEEVDAEIHVSGRTKSDIVEHLKIAAAQHPKAMLDAQNLLRNSEENGSQHIYFFKPISKEILAGLSDGERIAESLWGKRWKQKMGFPKFDLVPDGLTFADFRVSEAAPGRDHWVCKIYGHKTEWDPQEPEYLDDGRRKRREWLLKEIRSVYLLRMNRYGLLEVRVPRGNSAEDDRQQLENAFNLFGKVIRVQDFEPFCLQKARRRLYTARTTRENIYRIGPWRFLDSTSSSVSGRPASQEEGMTSEAAEAADFMNGKPQTFLQQLSMTWTADKVTSEHSDGLAVTIGGTHSHRLTIPARSVEFVVAYVVDQLLKHHG